MQTLSNGDSLHEISNPVSLEILRKNAMNLLSADFVQKVVKVYKSLIPNYSVHRLVYKPSKAGANSFRFLL